MTPAPARVRARRSRPGAVAVTGTSGALGDAFVRRLAAAPEALTVIGIDPAASDVAGVEWRRAEMRDRPLRAALRGAGTVVHLATDRGEADPAERRARNVGGTAALLAAAGASGVRRVVLLTSAAVFGARADNPVPLAEDAPLRAEADRSLVGDWLEMERLADQAAAEHADLEVTRVRPASLVGVVTDPLLPRALDASRLLRIRDADPHWQFCHTDDLLAALECAVRGTVSGVVTVGSPGWLAQDDVARITGRRSVTVPAAVAMATASRLHRAGVLAAPVGELDYLMHPWVIGAQQLLAAGWVPAYDNEAALRAHLDELERRPPRGGGALGRRDARAAAGATVAVIGTLAVARARRRRHRG